MFKCFVYENATLVAVGRALADGGDCSYICDVAVLPSYQGTGLGKQVVSDLVEMSSGHKKIILYAVPGKEPFYRKFGFMRMKTAMAIFKNQQQQVEGATLVKANPQIKMMRTGKSSAAGGQRSATGPLASFAVGQNSATSGRSPSVRILREPSFKKL